MGGTTPAPFRQSRRLTAQGSRRWLWVSRGQVGQHVFPRGPPFRLRLDHRRSKRGELGIGNLSSMLRDDRKPKDQIAPPAQISLRKTSVMPREASSMAMASINVFADSLPVPGSVTEARMRFSGQRRSFPKLTSGAAIAARLRCKGSI